MALPLSFPPSKTSGLKQPGNFRLGQLAWDAGDDRLPFQVLSFTPPYYCLTQKLAIQTVPLLLSMRKTDQVARAHDPEDIVSGMDRQAKK